MYTLAVQRDFIANHYLIGDDWGAENRLHAHHYRVEVRLEGERLDQHGYLVDIVEIDALLDQMVSLYRDATLNDLPAFSGLNPSIEHFARMWCEDVVRQLHSDRLAAITVVIWENEIAWTSYRMGL